MVDDVFESYAQNGEDIVLWRALGHVTGGTYVDVGAADPDVDSVTKAFYERGWSGVDIEPSREHAAALRSARPRDVVVEECAGAAAGTLVLHEVSGTGLSSVVLSAIEALDESDGATADIEVPVRRLDDMLEVAGLADRPIHFLKIDVEGFEEDVLRGIDLDRWRPWVVVVEATAPRSRIPAHHSWEPILLDHRYTFCLFDGLNRFYAAEEHNELVDVLAAPACVFDQPFMTPPHSAIMRMYHSTLSDYESLNELYGRTLEDFERLERTMEQTVADYQRVDGLLAQTVADYQRVEAELLRTQRDYAALDERLAQIVSEHQQLSSLYDEAVVGMHAQAAEVRAVTDERRTLSHGVTSMAAEMDELRAGRDRAEHELSLTHQTVSWRITAPLRRLRRRLGD